MFSIKFFAFLCLAVATLQALPQKLNTKSSINFVHYWSHDEINAHLVELALEFPNLVFAESDGVTVEGRILKAIRVSLDNSNTRPIIFIDGGIRAREWLSQMTAIHWIHEIVEHYYEFTDLLQNIDLVFIPIINPDGNNFSRETDRLWVKTRSTNDGSACLGIDANRNFDINWNTVGTSNDPCSDNFAGNAPFSSVEADYVRSVLTKYADRVKMYISIQSYGSKLLYPFSYTNENMPTNAAELQFLGDQVATVIAQMRGTVYAVGTAAMLEGQISGTSLDYAQSIGVPLPFVIELPGGGSNGYDLPEDEIETVLQETFPGFLVMAEYVANNY